MDDLYEFLVGDTPQQVQIPAIVEQLRRRRALGELGALTGDRVLSPFGSSMMKQADTYAEGIATNRERDRDNRRTEAYQKGQLEHQAKVLEATLARDRDMADYRRRMAEAAARRAEAAYLKAQQGGAAKKTKLRQGDIKDLQDLSQTVLGMDDIMRQMDAGVSLGTKTVAGIPIPGSRVLANTAASMGLGSKKDKESFALFQQWDRLYNLAERNRLFGATLSANEQRAWRNANPSVLQTDEQIRSALPVMKKVFNTRLQNKVKGLITEGYDENAIYEYAGLGSPEPTADAGGEFPVPTQQDYELLASDPSPEAIQEFIEYFGTDHLPAEYGAILNGQ